MPADNCVLTAENISKSYGRVHAVDGVSLDVREGEILGFLGPNGAGKTTTIGIICGLLRPDLGRVLIRGVDAFSRSAGARLRLGFCPQSIVVWDMLTCMEQLEFMGEMYDVPGRAARARAGELLEALGLGGKRGSLARTLSGGMKRRLNLALALVHDPDILVLDEPEAGLDPQSRVLVRGYIRSLAGKKTVILTTHNMDEADRLADRVAIIDHGRILTVDTPEALKRRVGEGDVLEIELDGGEERCGDAERGLAAVRSVAPNAALDGRTIIIRSLGAAGILSPAMDELKRVGLRPGEVRLRENTLEDVFISLTGERLRE
jgi:ABC-2 type transport system ATP-binding protein